MSISAAVLYVLLISYLSQFMIFPAIRDIWMATSVQIAIYLLAAIPFLFVNFSLLRLFRTSNTQIIIGIVLVVLAMMFAMIEQDRNISTVLHTLLRQSVTGVVEELIFRGYIWQKSSELSNSTVTIILINVISFTIVHIPMVIAHNQSMLFLLGIAIIGAVLAIVRYTYKNLTLPSFLHTAINISA